MSPDAVLGEALWKCLHHPGEDTSTLISTDDGWRLEGLARIRFPEGPTTVRYVVDCTRDWGPKTARIELRRKRQDRVLHIQVDSRGNWEVGGFRRKDLHGSAALDLAASPATNTIAVRRLDLPIGGSQEIPVAWMTFPDLEVRPVRQRYSRLSNDNYRYEGLHNGFIAEFDVDELGFVLNYPGFWERVHPSRHGTRGRRPTPSMPRPR